MDGWKHKINIMEDKRKIPWREKQLLELLQDRVVSTATIVDEADMSKATVLKYLEGLRGQGLVSTKMIGPTKLWWATKFCEKCGEKLVKCEYYTCPDCGIRTKF